MSQATIESSIRTLLMEEGRVCLPGIGTLTVEAQPALVSLMEGKASPPSKYVSFNGNLTVDDGRLRQEVGDPEAVSRYLQSVRDSLALEDAFALPGVGKLYHQGTTEIRFTPGAINLSKSSFGLPAVPVRPVTRKEAGKAGSTARPRNAASAQSRSPAVRQPRLMTSWVWYLLGTVGILLAIFLVFRLAGTIGLLLESNGDERREDTVAERSVLAPAAAAAAAAPPRPTPAVPATDVRPAPPPQLPDRVEEAAATERVELGAPPQNEAVIAIGLYGRERNVRKQVRRLQEAGYVPYTDREGRNTRVGLRVSYDDPAELTATLRAVRDRYTEDAFIMRINGREQRPQ